MNAAIDITGEQRKTLVDLLCQYIPGVPVWAYGSRVKWTAHPNSDLDLVVFTAPSQHHLVSSLRNSIAESDLPFLVDLHIWDEIPERFREIIRREHVILQEQKDDSNGLTASRGTRPFGELFSEPPRNGINRPKAVRGAGVKMVNMGELFAHSRLRNVPMDRVKLVEPELQRFLLSDGDLLFARQSLVLEGAGQCAIFLCDDEPVTFESHVTRVRLDSKLADPAFYYYYLQSPHGKAVIRSIVEQGAGASGIRGSELKTLNVLWCPEKEQREIAKVLSILDDKIEMNRKATETLEAIAQAIFKSWFVSFDPVRAKAEGLKPEGMDASTAALFPCEFEASKYGASPKGWATIPLYEIADFQNGAAYRDIHFSDDDEGLPVIKIAELKSGVTASTRFTTSDLGEKYRIDQAEILFSWSGNPDTSIDAFVWVGGPAWLNQHIFRVRENGKASRARVYFQLKVLRPEFAEIARDKQTTGLGHVTIADMKRLMVCQPTTGVALEFDKIAGPIFERVVSNLLSIRILESLRDTLLPRLISGKLRVPDAEKMVEAVL